MGRYIEYRITSRGFKPGIVKRIMKLVPTGHTHRRMLMAFRRNVLYTLDANIKNITAEYRRGMPAQQTPDPLRPNAPQYSIRLGAYTTLRDALSGEVKQKRNKRSGVYQYVTQLSIDTVAAIHARYVLSSNGIRGGYGIKARGREALAFWAGPPTRWASLSGSGEIVIVRRIRPGRRPPVKPSTSYYSEEKKQITTYGISKRTGKAVTLPDAADNAAKYIDEKIIPAIQGLYKQYIADLTDAIEGAKK